MRSGNKGFSLIEALVSVTLVAVGVVGAIGGLGSLARAQADLQERERMFRLARAKYDEIVATGISYAPTTGDFEDWNEDRYSWEMETEVTGVENLDAVRLVVTKESGSFTEVMVEGLVYTAPPPPVEEEEQN
jgi:prepilin-type N-terminal cleavage/methylation domain-containing protein